MFRLRIYDFFANRYRQISWVREFSIRFRFICLFPLLVIVYLFEEFLCSPTTDTQTRYTFLYKPLAGLELFRAHRRCPLSPVFFGPRSYASSFLYFVHSCLHPHRFAGLPQISACIDSWLCSPTRILCPIDFTGFMGPCRFTVEVLLTKLSAGDLQPPDSKVFLLGWISSWSIIPFADPVLDVINKYTMEQGAIIDRPMIVKCVEVISQKIGFYNSGFLFHYEVITSQCCVLGK